VEKYGGFGLLLWKIMLNIFGLNMKNELKINFSEKEDLLRNVDGLEFVFIKNKAGVTYKRIGQEAVKHGKKEPYGISTVHQWSYRGVLPMSKVALLYNCMEPEHWTALRKEWKLLHSQKDEIIPQVIE
jgi:hypothetical protein